MTTQWHVLANKLAAAGISPSNPEEIEQMVEEGIAQVYATRHGRTDLDISAFITTRSTKAPTWREVISWCVCHDEQICARLLANVAEQVEMGLFLITEDSELIAAAQGSGFTPIINSMVGDEPAIGWAYDVGVVSRLPRSVHRRQLPPQKGKPYLLVRPR